VKAIDVLPGGYAQKFDRRREWVQVTGRMAMHAQRSHAAEGSRRERRSPLSKGLKHSEVKQG
jgi:hypothetical protein